MNNLKKPGVYFAMASVAVVLIAFQNCSKTNFTQSQPEMSLKTEDMIQGTATNSDLPQDIVVQPPVAPPVQPPAPGDSGDVVVPAPGASPVVTATPVVMPSPVNQVPPVVGAPVPPVVKGPGKSPGNPNAGGVGNGKPPQALNAADVVECDLKRPSSKVIFSRSLGVGSNASATRVCMSEHACLNLLNAYAAARDCSLAAGAATSQASGQCTAIFPGSRGTCKKAQILTDAQVTDLITAMGAVK
jgi:hypothetical protein